MKSEQFSSVIKFTGRLFVELVEEAVNERNVRKWRRFFIDATSNVRDEKRSGREKLWSRMRNRDCLVRDEGEKDALVTDEEQRLFGQG